MRFLRYRIRLAVVLGPALVVVVSTQAVATASAPRKHGTCARSAPKASGGKQRHSGKDGKRNHAKQACRGDTARKARSKRSLEGAGHADTPAPAPPPVASPIPPPSPSPTPSSPPTVRNKCEEKPPPPTIVPTPPSGPEQTSLIVEISVPGGIETPKCFAWEPLQGTIDVTDASSGQTVVTEAIGRNQRAYIPVSPGTYDLTAEIPAGAFTPSAETCTKDYEQVGMWSEVDPGPVTAREGKQTFVSVTCNL
jgi:hypothetical protein